jgi:DNA-binding HxlR family transcriptional regulator
MPIKGRPRLVAKQASGTKLFVDDLREVIKLSQTEPRKTISDTLRELVHEALVNRRLQAFKRDQQEAQQTEQTVIGNDLKEIKTALTKLASEQLPVQPLLTEILGFTIAAERKSHLLLQNFLLSRGVSEEAAQKLLAEQETRSRQNVETILHTILPSSTHKESK